MTAIIRHGNQCQQLRRIEKYLPRQRGNVSHKNLTVINAMSQRTAVSWQALRKRCGT